MRSTYESLFGDVVLDLRQATVTAAEVTIDAGRSSATSSCSSPNPSRSRSAAGRCSAACKQDAGQVAPPGAPKVIVVGGTVFGDVRVRAKRLRERLAERLRAQAPLG